MDRIMELLLITSDFCVSAPFDFYAHPKNVEIVLNLTIEHLNVISEVQYFDLQIFNFFEAPGCLCMWFFFAKFGFISSIMLSGTTVSILIFLPVGSKYCRYRTLFTTCSRLQFDMNFFKNWFPQSGQERVSFSVKNDTNCSLNADVANFSR